MNKKCTGVGKLSYKAFVEKHFSDDAKKEIERTLEIFDDSPYEEVVLMSFRKMIEENRFSKEDMMNFNVLFYYIFKELEYLRRVRRDLYSAYEYAKTKKADFADSLAKVLNVILEIDDDTTNK